MTPSGKPSWTKEETVLFFNCAIADAMQRGGQSQVYDARPLMTGKNLAAGASIDLPPPEITIPIEVWKRLRFPVSVTARLCRLKIIETKRYIDEPNSVRLIFERKKNV